MDILAVLDRSSGPGGMDLPGFRLHPHPGGLVRRWCLEPRGLSVTRAAEGLSVTRQALSEVVNE